jgi:hypothetical protein
MALAELLSGKECVLMKSLASVLAVAALVLSSGAMQSAAKDKRPSLPMHLMSAKTVYVDNQTTTAELLNTAYTELSKWGRLQVVDAPQKADIILRLSNGNFVKFVSGDDAAAPSADAKAAKQNFVGADESVPPGSTRISVIDPKSGNSVWSDIRKTDSPKVATHMLDGLREALDPKK